MRSDYIWAKVMLHIQYLWTSFAIPNRADRKGLAGKLCMRFCEKFLEKKKTRNK